MAKIRVGINGFGRIGRNFFRAQLERGGDFEIVAANDLGDTKTMAHLLKHDSVLGTLDAAGRGGRRLHPRRRARDQVPRPSAIPRQLPWGDLGVDVVIESTGFFTDRDGAQKHLDAGAKKVVISAPATDPDLTIVLGVNDRRVRPGAASHHLERVVHDELRRARREAAARGLHDRARLHDDHPRVHERPAVLDLPHEDLRRARAAAINLIPTRPAPRARSGSCCPIQGQGRRHVDARAGADRLDR